MNQDYSIEKVKLVNESLKTLREELGREPFDEELAVYSALNLQEVKEIRPFTIEKSEYPDFRQDFQLRFKVTVKNIYLEEARKEKKLLQNEIAKKAGISSGTYCAIECCRIFPSDFIQEKIALVLEQSAFKLFPEWLQIFTEKWSKAEKDKIIPIHQISLDNPKVRMIGYDGREQFDRIAKVTIAKNVLGKAISKLSEREQKILKERFFDRLTTNEVAKINGISTTRIRQIEEKALSKLRDQKEVNLLQQ